MQNKIKTISLPLPYRLGSVNCYLINTGEGFFLIDTGPSNQRSELERMLTHAGCMPGDLKLIVLTHGDFDHAGNAAHLKSALGAKIAMHQGDAGMVVDGDMFSNRQKGNTLIRVAAPLFFRFGKNEKFTPDIYLDQGSDLSEYGLDARVLSIPGHSLGSIGILTADGSLFCGDLLDCQDEPGLNSIMDNMQVARDSLEGLKRQDIKTVYPGHGKPFSMEKLLQIYP